VNPVTKVSLELTEKLVSWVLQVIWVNPYPVQKVNPVKLMPLRKPSQISSLTVKKETKVNLDDLEDLDLVVFHTDKDLLVNLDLKAYLVHLVSLVLMENLVYPVKKDQKANVVNLVRKVDVVYVV